MMRSWRLVLLCVALTQPCSAQADVVLDWNAVMRNVMQTDGILNSPALANPGWSTRTIAMTNAAMYDSFQAIQRTHKPFLVNTSAPGASKTAAAAQAAYDILLDCYPLQQSILDAALQTSLGPTLDASETAGVALGHSIAAAYIANRLNDGANQGSSYTPLAGPGNWRPDPWNPTQVAWGPSYGQVPTFAVRDSASAANAHDLIALLPALPALDSQAYADAYNQVLDYGALDVYGPANTPTSRTADQTAVGIFWGYDRASMGPPPVLFIRSLEEIAAAIGNSPEDNARLFAMATVSQADAAIAAWDAKYQYNFWRPVAGIHEGDTDNNPNTMQDLYWRPLGAPGSIPDDNDPLTDADFKDDFTPPFPAWVSGHATMGATIFKMVELFFGTNDFSVADTSRGADPVTSAYMLTSEEANSGGIRSFTQFAQYGLLDVNSYAGSPDGENAISRLFLGVHWIMDQRDGQQLGHSIAEYVSAHYFQAVPEPTAIALGLFGAMGSELVIRRRRT